MNTDNQAPRVVRLSIFNEVFWDRSLIYTQNIIPLKLLVKQRPDIKLEIVAFISIIDILRYWTTVFQFVAQQRNHGIRVILLPTLYARSRLLYPRYPIMPLICANLAPYVLMFRLLDALGKRKPLYWLRSYEVASGFCLFYGNGFNLAFDPRTDMIQELSNIGVWAPQSLSAKLWKRLERLIVEKCKVTLFISGPMKADVLCRCGLKDDAAKYVIYYNQADFSRFNIKRHHRQNNFLYSGSLGNWNALQAYLEFFSKVREHIDDAQLYVATSVAPSKYAEALSDSKFDSIRGRIVVFDRPDYSDLPRIYSECKYGLQLMSYRDTRIGVKFVEYIAAGLVPIVNENVAGAADFCRKHALGFVVDSQLERVDKSFCSLIERARVDELPEEVRNLIDVHRSHRELAKLL